MQQRAAGPLVVLAAVLLVATTVAAYAWRVAFDADQFTDRAVSALQKPDVRDAIAERVTDALVARQPDLIAGRPLVASAVSGVVGGQAFAGLFRRAVGDVHRAAFRTDRDTVTLTLVDIGIVAAAALRQLDPKLASELELRENVVVVDRAVGDVAADAARRARTVRWMAWVMAALTVLAAGAALLVSRDRRRTAAQLGLGAAAAGVAVVALEAIAMAAVLDRVGEDDLRAAAAGVWDAYLGDLRTTGWIIAGCGALLSAAASSLIRPVEVEQPLRRAWQAIATEPRSPLLRVLRGVALVAGGVLIVASPSAMLVVASTLAGLYVVYKGAEALLRVIAGPERERPRPRRPRARRVAAGVVAALLAVAAVSAYASGGGLDEPVPASTGCNGHAALCDRPLDRVTLAATHNAMSVPLRGWFASLQDRPIADQLDDGVRGLLLDTHYADRLGNGRIRTYFGDDGERARALQDDAVSDESVAAALRLRERLGFRGEGERGMYLCHTFCELGATPLEEVLDDIRDFLVLHPSDVLVIVNEDYVTPSDFVGAMADAGLDEFALTPPPAGAPWPTLRRLADSGRRLVVLAENRAGAAPWYQLAYERLTQETPFSFSATEQLTDPAALPASCRENRGRAGAPLFLMNHWINTDPAPLPSNAAVVNAREPLLARARECARLRGHPVNLLAVDFYREGDVFGVVDALNGL